MQTRTLLWPTLGAMLPRKPPPTDLQVALLMEQDNRCLYCGLEFGTSVWVKARETTLEVNWDHMIPYAYVGTNPPDNWAAACQLCNGYKSDLIFASLDDIRAYILEHARRYRHDPAPLWAPDPAEPDPDEVARQQRRIEDYQRVLDGAEPITPRRRRKRVPKRRGLPKPGTVPDPAVLEHLAELAAEADRKRAVAHLAESAARPRRVRRIPVDPSLIRRAPAPDPAEPDPAGVAAWLIERGGAPPAPTTPARGRLTSRVRRGNRGSET